MKSLPKGIGTLKDIKSREDKAFNLSANWQDILDDAYEFFLPNRNLFDREDSGQKKMDRVFDSTALQSIQTGASKLQESIAPIWARWANFEPSEQIKKIVEKGDVGVSINDIKENLEEQAEIVFDYINRSNLGTQFYECALDILIGTGTIKVDEDLESDEMPVIFSTIAQKNIAFEEGPHGTVESHFRRFKVKARNLKRLWPGFEASASINRIIDEKPDEDIVTHEAIIFEPKAKVYHGVVWVKGEESASWIADFEDSSPFITSRYAKVAGEVRGRGPAIQALPDVRSLNKAKEFVLQKAAIDLAGMWTATDDGVTNPYNIKISPGVVIPVGSNNSQNPSLQRLDTGSNLQLAQFEITELQNSIKLAFFGDLRDPAGPVRSATEIAIESRELAKKIGSAFGRLQTELLIPLLKRVVWILTRRGLINPININGRDVTVKFTSPLARAQDSVDLQSVQEAVMFTMESAGPDQAKMAFKLEDFGTWAAEKTGMPTELVRSQSEKAQVIQAGAAAAQAELDAGSPQQPNLQAVQ